MRTKKIKIICDKCGNSHILNAKKMYYVDEFDNVVEYRISLINSINIKMWNCCI